MQHYFRQFTIWLLFAFSPLIITAQTETFNTATGVTSSSSGTVLSFNDYSFTLNAGGFPFFGISANSGYINYSGGQFGVGGWNSATLKLTDNSAFSLDRLVVSPGVSTTTAGLTLTITGDVATGGTVTKMQLLGVVNSESTINFVAADGFTNITNITFTLSENTTSYAIRVLEIERSAAAASDSDPPVLSTLALNGSPAAGATSITYTATFDEAASNVSADDFELTKTTSANGTIGTPSTSDNINWSVPITGISGAGTLRLDLKATTNIVDGSGNGNNNNGYVAAKTGDIHSVDNLPTVTLSQTNAALSEAASGTTGTVTATLSHAYTADVTVNLISSGATETSDFTISTKDIVISSGATTGSATITIIDDSELEDTETLTVEINTVTNGSEDGTQSQDFTITNDDFAFSIKVFLEGPLSGTTMSTDISETVPTDPNDVYAGVQAETAAASLPANTVDWVEVEIRTGTSSGDRVGTNRAGILKSDGSVVDKDGNAFTLSQADGTSYYIVIHHRNHLSVMSKDPVVSSSGTYSIDFTEAGVSYGTGGDINIGGEYAMIAGDANGDGTVNGDDLTAWRNENGKAFSYSSSGNDKTDLNMDGVINAVDRNEYQQKNSSPTPITTQVPGT